MDFDKVFVRLFGLLIIGAGIIWLIVAKYGSERSADNPIQ